MFPLLLWLDDLRDPKDFTDTDVFKRVIWAKTFSEALSALDGCSDNITHISLDNDLGEDKEGNDVLNLVEELLHNGELPNLREVYVHSHNPSAVDKMMLAKQSLSSYGVLLIQNRA